MGRTLNLLTHLLSNARRQLDMDQPRQALRHLRQLQACVEASEAPDAEIHQLLGETYLKLGDYRRARRHLLCTIRQEPQNAEANYLLARAIECDPYCDAGRAARFYHRALELAPNNTRFLADAGGYQIQMGRLRKGTALLARAVELAPDDRELLQALVQGLCDAECFGEARRAVDLARFRIRCDAWLNQLRDEVEYRRAHAGQTPPVRGVAVLPYLRIWNAEPVSVRGRKFRRDALSPQRPHFPRGFHRLDTGRSG